MAESKTIGYAVAIRGVNLNTYLEAKARAAMAMSANSTPRKNALARLC